MHRMERLLRLQVRESAFAVLTSQIMRQLQSPIRRQSPCPFAWGRGLGTGFQKGVFTGSVFHGDCGLPWGRGQAHDPSRPPPPCPHWSSRPQGCVLVGGGGWWLVR